VVSIVMSLPTTGPMLLTALQSQDMYLAGSFLMFLAMLTVLGVLVSDIALAFLDPRIRLGGGSTK
jgi:peptide/nickel transport system permease protein